MGTRWLSCSLLCPMSCVAHDVKRNLVNICGLNGCAQQWKQVFSKVREGGAPADSQLIISFCATGCDPLLHRNLAASVQASLPLHTSSMSTWPVRSAQAPRPRSCTRGWKPALQKGLINPKCHISRTAPTLWTPIQSGCLVNNT